MSVQTHSNATLKDCGLFVMQDHPYIGASPDGILSCDCCPLSVLEVKCPASLSKFQSREMMKGENKMLKRTSSYFCEVQLQMGIAEVRCGDFVYESEHSYLLLSVPFEEGFFTDVQRCYFFFFFFNSTCFRT